MKCVWIVAICLAGCDLSKQPAIDRPETLAYITETILKPSCGTAECHSAMKAQSTDVFDSVEAAQKSLADNGLIDSCEKATGMPPPCPRAASVNSYLFTVIDASVTNPKGFGDRMPIDQALSDSDITLIGDWIDDGAEGFTFPTVNP